MARIRIEHTSDALGTFVRATLLDEDGFACGTGAGPNDREAVMMALEEAGWSHAEAVHGVARVLSEADIVRE